MRRTIASIRAVRYSSGGRGRFGEWKLHVETLAHACDWLEYLWTGRDMA